MTGSPYDPLIRDLAADLKPVRRLPPPGLRALGWLAVVAAIAVALAAFADLHAMWERITGAPDMWLAVLGSAATAVLAAIAAFELSLPDAPRAWAWLPLPGALLWVAASGFGCLRVWIAPESHVAVLGEARDCLVFIVALSVPLSALMVLMLRRACPLQPGLTAAIGGLAVAAAAATLLNFFHPYDAAATDLTVHAFAVALVVIANRALGGRIFAAPNFARTM
ncbi:MAG TPA: NrsF family protein [Pseudolabrys sp.]|nr:NrsF family protein [Pseudolabrys sp.]